MGKLAPVVTIELDKPRNLKLTLNGMVEFKKVIGKEVWELPPEKRLSSDELQALLWACLIHEDKSLTLEQAGNLFGIWNMAEVTQAILKAYKSAMPEVDKDATDHPLATSPQSG